MKTPFFLFAVKGDGLFPLLCVNPILKTSLFGGFAPYRLCPILPTPPYANSCMMYRLVFQVFTPILIYRWVVFGFSLVLIKRRMEHRAAAECTEFVLNTKHLGKMFD